MTIFQKPYAKAAFAAAVFGWSLSIGGCAAPWHHGPQAKHRSTPPTHPGSPAIETLPFAAADQLPYAPYAFSEVEPVQSLDEERTLVEQGPEQFDVVADTQPDSVLPTTLQEPLPFSKTSLSELGNDNVEGEVTVGEVMLYAMSHHPALKVRRHEVEVARAGLVDAGLIPNPRLVFDVEDRLHESDPTELTTRVEFTILTGDKRRHRRAAAEAGILRARLALGTEAENVLLAVVDAVTEVIYCQECLALVTHLSELAAKRAEAEKSRLEALGSNAKLVDKIEAEIDAADMEAERLEASAELTVARAMLARAVGLSPPRLWAIQGQLQVDPRPLMPLETVLEIARQRRPELAEARGTVSESRFRHALAHAEAKPDLVLGPRYQDPLCEDNDRIGGRFNMDLPLFDRNQGEILETAAQINADCAMQEVAEMESLSDVTEAYLELVSRRRSLEFYNTHVAELIERNEALIQDPDVQQGITATQILEIQQELGGLQLQHLELRYRCHGLARRLELFLGEQITEDALDDGPPEGEIVSPIIMPQR